MIYLNGSCMLDPVHEMTWKLNQQSVCVTFNVNICWDLNEMVQLSVIMIFFFHLFPALVILLYMLERME